MQKTKLFVDFDSTITNSLEVFIRTFNQKHNTNIDWTKVEKYDFVDQIPNLTSEEKHSIFDSQEFFDNLDFININTYEVLQKLNEEYEIHIATIGTPTNLGRKAIWLNNNLPFVKHYHLLYDSENTMNKSTVNMEGSIFIDDVLSNIISSNADFKIVFGDIFEWNLTNEYTRCYNWSDVEKLLI